MIDVDAAEWSDLVGIYLGNLYSGHHNVRVRFELFTIDVLTFDGSWFMVRDSWTP